MNHLEQIKFLNQILLSEMPQYEQEGAQFPDTVPQQRRLLRSLMNLRSPRPISPEFLAVQDELLQREATEKGIVLAETLPQVTKNITLWQGDITCLGADAIVNAANDALLGCFAPCHGCIDNAIHSAAGLQLREACHHLMEEQGHREGTGLAKVTSAYNLPAKYVLHTVGPIVYGDLTDTHCAQLRDCYQSCLALAEAHGLSSIAFCCISTGEFHFPNQRAAEIAVDTVQTWQKNHHIHVIFNVFKDEDWRIYERLL